jgi:hypothetical protein
MCLRAAHDHKFADLRNGGWVLLWRAEARPRPRRKICLDFELRHLEQRRAETPLALSYVQRIAGPARSAPPQAMLLQRLKQKLTHALLPPNRGDHRAAILFSEQDANFGCFCIAQFAMSVLAVHIALHKLLFTLQFFELTHTE